MTTRSHLALTERLAAFPFNPFRGSGQGVRGQFSDRFARVQFASADGLPLVGRLALHRDGIARPALILGHGVWASKELDAIVDLAEFFFANGWHAFAPDFQGHGESAALSDAPYTMGWKEGDNLVGAARFLREMPEVRGVALMGFSMSGAAAILAAASAPELFAAAVVASPPAKQEIHFIMSHIDKWLRIAKTDPVTYFNRAGAYYGISGEEVRRRDETVEALRSLTVPTLLIQAADDEFIPPPDQAQVEAAARANPNVLVIAQARGGHGVELFLNDRYWFKGVAATFLKAQVAPDLDLVRDDPWPALDIQLKLEMGWEGWLLGTVWLRNSSSAALENVTLRLPLFETPPPAYTAAPPMFREARQEGRDLIWEADRLPGGAQLVGPFTVAIASAEIPQGTRLRTRARALWRGPEPGEVSSNEVSYTQR
ncbi:MAG: alpha/beta fold hydrolase [Chloroflexota bacterium]|nr:lysophospholipase [Dehalococcoidia bacterium]MDW8253823.1 alpha/beta fold hydrolase [Chloroflexota bacterium]